MSYLVHFKEGEEENSASCRRWKEEGSFVKLVQRWQDNYTGEEHTKEIFIPLVNIIKIEEI